MKLKQIRDDTRGNALVEFTVTFPIFLLLMFGLAQAGLLLYAQSALQHGVEMAARCASVNYAANKLGLNQSCFTVGGVALAPSTVTTSTIEQYAAENSFGLIKPVSTNFRAILTPPPSGGNVLCPTNIGYLVTGRIGYNLINYIFSVTLTAESNFPISCTS
jgi:Flp pilus assembly protein TadG